MLAFSRECHAERHTHTAFRDLHQKLESLDQKRKLNDLSRESREEEYEDGSKDI